MLTTLLLLSCVGDRGSDRVDDSATDDRVLLGILLTPEALVLPQGSTAQLKATGLFDDRTSDEITHLVTWSSADGRVAEISNDLDSEGLVSGASLGETALTASWQGVDSVPLEVTVTDAQILGLTVEPQKLDIAVGEEVQLKAIAAYSDGNRADSSSQVRWITDDGGVAQIASGGVLTGAGKGGTTIHAEWDGHSSADVPVNVVAEGKADLAFIEATAEASATDITLTATIGNLGTKGASEFWVDVFIDPASEPTVGDLGDDFGLVPYVGPDEMVTAKFVLPADTGPHRVWILLDTDDAVPESDESNNLVGGDIDVGGGEVGPNLTVDYFQYIADSESLYFVVDIYNAGSDDVDEFYVDLFVDPSSTPSLYDDGDDYVTVSKLAAGEVEYADFIYDTTTCWPCLAYVLVDSYNYIEETDEDDNLAGPLYAYNE